MRNRAWPGGVVVALLLIAGCGPANGSAGPAEPSGATPSVSAPAAASGTSAAVVPTPSAPASAAQPAGNPDRCTTAELAGSLGPAEGAAGSVIQTLLLTNAGGRTCELTGFPGVSYVAGDDGHQVGPAAVMSGERGAPVRLAPGAAAGALLKMVNVVNYDAAVCRPTPVRGLRVYPPGDTASLFVPVDGTGCAGTPPGDQLSVQTLESAPPR